VSRPVRAPRLSTLGAHVAALGLSTAVHAAVFLPPLGHPRPAQATSDDIGVEVLAVPAATLEAPDPAPPPSAPPTRWPTHTHPYPVPPSHDWTPHDPSLEHRIELPSPAPAKHEAPATVHADDDDTPRFSIVVGAGATDATRATAAPRLPDDDEPSAQGPAFDVPAGLLREPAPTYPAAARADGIEGDVVLDLVVGPSGNVEDARVVRRLGHGLDEAALEAARKFQFTPATKSGRPVRLHVIWSIKFRLR
jgi:protein TonB